MYMMLNLEPAVVTQEGLWSYHWQLPEAVFHLLLHIYPKKCGESSSRKNKTFGPRKTLHNHNDLKDSLLSCSLHLKIGSKAGEGLVKRQVNKHLPL